MAATLLLTLAATAFAQRTTNFSTWFPITTYPNQQTENVTLLLNEAMNTAGDDLYLHFRHRCIANQVYDVLASAQQTAGFIPPSTPFDGVHFVGASGVSVWAFDTSDNGVVLIDSMNNADEFQQVVLAGLASKGYKGSDIRALIITHEHGDHYGGAKFAQDTFGMPVYASEEAWQAMANSTGTPPPARNETLVEGPLTFGNTTFTFVHTPGHTPGTMSFFVPVMDKGEGHVAGFYGGGGIPSTAAARAQQVQSFTKFADAAKVQGADVLMSNHQTHDNSIYNFDVLAAGVPRKNPFIIGTDAYVRYLTTMGLCVRLKAARDGQALSV